MITGPKCSSCGRVQAPADDVELKAEDVAAVLSGDVCLARETGARWFREECRSLATRRQP